MRREYWLYNEVADDETFERLWIGAGRLFLENKYPDEIIQAVRLQPKRSYVVLIHGLFMQGCTDEIGFRFFACYSDKVSYNVTSGFIHQIVMQANSANYRRSHISATWSTLGPTLQTTHVTDLWVARLLVWDQFRSMLAVNSTLLSDVKTF